MTKTYYKVLYTVGTRNYDATVNDERFDTIEESKKRIDDLLRWPAFETDMIDNMLIVKHEIATVATIPALRREP